MTLFDEMKGDVMRLVAMLGVVIGFVLLFLLWSATGMFGILALAAIGIAGFFIYKRMRSESV